MHIVHCMMKPRLDLESAHQAGHFEYKNIQIGQIEVAMSSASIVCDIVGISISIVFTLKHSPVSLVVGCRQFKPAKTRLG